VFIRLDDVAPADLSGIGSKAFNCARLRQAGFPVPDGVAVSSDTTDADVATLLGHPWFSSLSGVRFAVRSSGLGEDSAEHSFAGLHETRLNVERDQLIDAVLSCRRSAGSLEASSYRAARQIAADEARIGVFVQRMVPATASGVAFTLNPVTGADEVVVNAGAGLGEALVSGQIDPDEFRVGKRDRRILSTRIGGNRGDGTPLLSPVQVTTLTDLLLRIEQHYGAPQDVEWCHDGEQFWIVQSRPVTTSRAASAQPSPGDPEWTRANLAEVMPDQLSPQALSIYVDLLDRGERDFFGKLFAPESELGPIIKAFHGRLYFNLSQLRHVTQTVGAAPADTLRSLGHSEEIRPEDEIARRPPLGTFLPALPDLLRLVFNSLRAGPVFQEHRQHLEEILERLAGDPAALSDAAIAETFDWWLTSTPQTLKAVLVMSGVQMHEDVLRKACKAVGFPFDRLVYPQLASGERSVSTQQAVDLVALADVARHEPASKAYLLSAETGFVDFRTALAGTEFLRGLDDFLGRYGHRGRYESDWALPRLHEDPSPALFAICTHLQGPPVDMQAAAARQEADAAEARCAFEARLTAWQRWTLLPRVRSTLRRLKQQYLWREAVRSDLTRVVSRLREWHLELANRFVRRGWIDRRDDYFLIDLNDVKAAALDPSRGPQLRPLAAKAAARLAAERDLRMPLLMRESTLEEQIGRLSDLPTPDSNGDSLTGLCVSPGSVEAEVVVLRDPRDFALMKPGAILVTIATDPSWTTLFTVASGVIVEVGGMLSHASTIAREFGLPALANVKDATRILKTGDRVKLDASAGRVIR